MVEILVVVVVLSLLLSITAPVIRRGKEEGRRVACMSNVGQLGMAWEMYATENGERICSALTHFNDAVKSAEYGLEGNTLNNWVADGPGLPFNGVANTEKAIRDGVLWSYVETEGLYLCPSDRRGLVRSYAVSHTMGCESSYGEKNFRKLPEIKGSGDRLVFIDAIAGSARHADGTIHNLGSFDPIDTARDLWMCGAMMLTGRHSGGCNMSYADMHVERWKWEDERTIAFIEGEMSFDEFQKASTENGDLFRLERLIRGAYTKGARNE